MNLLLIALIPGGAAGLGGVLLALWLNHRLRTAVRSLHQATQEIAQGNLERRLELRTGDELEALGESVNVMAGALAAQRRQLDAHASELQEALAERTLELQKARAVAVNQERIAAMGVLAAGVAHEIGNPLTAISAIVQGWRRSDGQASEKVDVLAENLVRIQQIVRSLVDYARVPGDDWSSVSLNALLQRTLALVRLDPRAKDVTLRERLDPELPRAESVESRLQQVFLNLVLNALDAGWSRSSSTASTRASAPTTPRSTLRACSRSGTTPGRGTSASCRTSSSGPWSWATGSRSAWRICPTAGQSRPLRGEDLAQRGHERLLDGRRHPGVHAQRRGGQAPRGGSDRPTGPAPRAPTPAPPARRRAGCARRRSPPRARGRRPGTRGRARAAWRSRPADRAAPRPARIRGLVVAAHPTRLAGPWRAPAGSRYPVPVAKKKTSTGKRAPARGAAASKQRASKQRASKQKASKQKASKQKASKQKASKQKASKQKASKQKASEQKASEQKASKQKAAERRSVGSAPGARRPTRARKVPRRGASARPAKAPPGGLRASVVLDERHVRLLEALGRAYGLEASQVDLAAVVREVLDRYGHRLLRLAMPRRGSDEEE